MNKSSLIFNNLSNRYSKIKNQWNQRNQENPVLERIHGKSYAGKNPLCLIMLPDHLEEVVEQVPAVEWTGC